VQRYTDRRGRLKRLIGRVVTGVSDRTEHNRKTTTETLLRRGKVAEATNEVGSTP
jgi:hypothetical protein